MKVYNTRSVSLTIEVLLITILLLFFFFFSTTEVLTWVPETFLARFPVSVKSLASPLVASAYGRRCVGLRPIQKIPAALEKGLWYPGY